MLQQRTYEIGNLEVKKETKTSFTSSVQKMKLSIRGEECILLRMQGFSVALYKTYWTKGNILTFQDRCKFSYGKFIINLFLDTSAGNLRNSL